MKINRYLLLLATLLAVSCMTAACASLDYTKPVTGFSDAVTVAEAKFLEAQAAIEKDQHEEALEVALKNPRWVRRYSKHDCLPAPIEPDDNSGEPAASGDGAPDASKDKPELNRCRLVVRKELDGEGGTPLSFPDKSLDLRRLMTPLRAYGDNLKKVTEADSTEAVASALGAAAANVKKLAKTVDEYNKKNGKPETKLEARISAYTGPVQEAFGFLIIHYLEQQKLEALREATKWADLIIDDAAGALSSVVDSAMHGVELHRQYLQYRELNSISSNQTPAQRVKPRIDNAAKIDEIQDANPKEAFDALSKAHHELTKFLAEGNPSSASFWERLEAFVAEAEKIAAIAEKFKEADKSLKKAEGAKK